MPVGGVLLCHSHSLSRLLKTNQVRQTEDSLRMNSLDLRRRAFRFQVQQYFTELEIVKRKMLSTGRIRQGRYLKRSVGMKTGKEHQQYISFAFFTQSFPLQIPFLLQIDNYFYNCSTPHHTVSTFTLSLDTFSSHYLQIHRLEDWTRGFGASSTPR